MHSLSIGLTTLYNRFHNPAETSPDIAELRRLHEEMDQAVAAAGKSPILDYLKQHAGWYSKDAILSGTGFPENRWNATIKELLESGQVERQGEKRGVRYRVRTDTMQ